MMMMMIIIIDVNMQCIDVCIHNVTMCCVEQVGREQFRRDAAETMELR